MRQGVSQKILSRNLEIRWKIQLQRFYRCWATHRLLRTGAEKPGSLKANISQSRTHFRVDVNASGWWNKSVLEQESIKYVEHNSRFCLFQLRFSLPVGKKLLEWNKNDKTHILSHSDIKPFLCGLKPASNYNSKRVCLLDVQILK
jgi:hypothetical protein